MTTTKPTTTIVIAKPRKGQAGWQVFGSYDGPDDRYVFGLKTFADADAAEGFACWMMDRFWNDRPQMERA